MIVITIDFSIFFFFNDTATTEIYTLSLHDALPIFSPPCVGLGVARRLPLKEPEESRGGSLRNLGSACPHFQTPGRGWTTRVGDRKSTRLNSSHANISYAVFCLKKKNIHTLQHSTIT